MTFERAAEILDPNHREHYDSIETVNEACRIGMKAIKKQILLEPKVKNGEWFCPICGESVEWMRFCSECGQALDWGEVTK